MTMSGTVNLRVQTIESLNIPIATSSDPTATPPSFAIATVGASAPGTYATGAWSGSYANGKTTAITPTLGGAGAGLAIVAGVSYDIWIKVVLGSETPQWVVGRVICT